MFVLALNKEDNMLRVERSTTIKAKPDAVAAFLAEPTNFAKIDRKVRGMKVIEQGQDYALVNIKGLFAGFFPYWMQFRMERQPDGGLIIYQVKGIAKSFDASFTLQETPEGTTVTHVESYSFYTLTPKLLDGLFTPYVARVVEEELYRFRRYVEEGWHIEIPWA
jgi:hypothetical protein